MVGHLPSHHFEQRSPFSPSTSVIQCSILLVWSKAMSRLQSQSSVIAVNSPMIVYCLTSLHQHLQQGKKKKKSGIVSWPVSRTHLARLLDSLANQPGATYCMWLIISFVTNVLLQPVTLNATHS